MTLNRCFVLILMYLSFVLILEKLYLTTKWKLLYLFLMVLCWKKVQKSLISWLKFWHFWCHLKVRFIHFTFQKLCRIYTEKFFQVGQYIHKNTLFLYLCDKKTGERNWKVSSRGIKLVNVLMYLSFYPKQKWLRWFWLRNTNIF